MFHPPDNPRFEPHHYLTYADLKIYLEWKYNIKIPLDTLYSMKHRGQLPTPDKVFLNKPMWLVKTIDAWVANGGRR